jgi:hypothetical protein
MEGSEQPNGHSAGTQVAEAMTANLVRLVAALGTTAGFVTLVAGTGGALLWVRFWSAGLPADQALAVVPRNQLVAAGAVTLGVYIVLALIAVAMVYAIESGGRATSGMRIGLAGIVSAQLVVVVLIVEDEFWKRLVGILIAAAYLGLVLISCTVALFVDEREESKGHLSRRERVNPLGITLSVVGVAVTTVIFYFLYQDDAAGRDFAPSAAVLVAAGLAAICFGIAESSGTRFWPYALSVFFSVVIFGAVFSTLRMLEHPKLSPVGLVRNAGNETSGLIGLLVARTDDRYWLAAVSKKCEDGAIADDGLADSGRVFSIPRSEVVDDQIGALINLDQADAQARRLLRETIRRQPGPAVPDAMRATGYVEALEPPAVSPC